MSDGTPPPYPMPTADKNSHNRHLGDGYDYRQAATAGAWRVREALAKARPPKQPREARRTPPSAAQQPLSETPDPAWTPHDAMPPTPTPGHWADGTPINDDEIPEEDR